MRGYAAGKGSRWYAVIYHGLDSVTGKEQRSWHAAGSTREGAEELARTLAAEATERGDASKSLTFGAYLTERWLPMKQVELRPTTFDGYRRKVHLHILPVLGRVRIDQLNVAQIETLYERKLRPTDGSRALSARSVLAAARHHPCRPCRRSPQRCRLPQRRHRRRGTEAAQPHPWNPRAWTEDQLNAFLRVAAGHRLYPAFRLAATNGMRRSELLGLN